MTLVHRKLAVIALSLIGLPICLILCACHSRQAGSGPTVEITTVPPAGEGGPVPIVPVAGRVQGADPSSKIVIYARAGNGVWWLQPMAIQPFASIAADGAWTSSTHLGAEYAALLVAPDYRPAPTVESLPAKGDKVSAVTVVKGAGTYSPTQTRMMDFGGYSWVATGITSERNGVPTAYSAENVTLDAKGHLHLRIVRKDDKWTCSQIILPQSFGYGTYAFTVSDVSHFEPATVLTLFTWDDLGGEQNHREMDIEISRWGDPAAKNAQFVLQPYYVSENVARFSVPPGRVTYSFTWQPDKLSFQAVPASDEGSPGKPFATHVFSSGIPTPGKESASINFCAFGYSKTPLKKDAEVIVEKFQYLP
jgi:hypothetical protein